MGKSKYKRSLVQDVSFISALLVFLSLWKIWLYYNFFGIDITQHISISEPVILALSSWATILFALLLGMVYPIFMNRINTGSYHVDRSKFYKRRFKDRIGTILIVLLGYYVLLLLTAVVYGIWLSFNGSFQWINLTSQWYILPLPLLMVFGLEIINEAKRFFVAKEINTIIKSAILLFVVMFGITALSRYDAYKVASGTNTGVSVRFMDGSKITSDSSTIYLGKTSEHVFHYDVKSKSGVVRKMSNVAAIEYPKPLALDDLTSPFRVFLNQYDLDE